MITIILDSILNIIGAKPIWLFNEHEMWKWSYFHFDNENEAMIVIHMVAPKIKVDEANLVSLFNQTPIFGS